MKKLFKLFTSKHLYVPSRWSTKPTAYGQDKELTIVDEFVCSKCGRKEINTWDFTKTDCN